MRVLVSAYACRPGAGSEHGTGWNWVMQIARVGEPWVLTREENRDAIELAIAENKLPQVHWVYCPIPRWLNGVLRGGHGGSLHYYVWQIAAYWTGRRLHREVSFQVVHHVTYARYWMPGFLAFLPVPFIFGPVGAGELPPPKLSRDISIQGRFREAIRRVAITLGERDPFLRSTLHRTRIAVAATPETAERLRALGAPCVAVLHPPVGVTGRDFLSLPVHVTPNPRIRFLSVGRLHHWKGFHLGLRAFARFQEGHPGAEYWIAGSGTEMKRLKTLTAELGLGDSVWYPGRVDRKEYFRMLSSCTALVHPGYHDPGAWVVVEAMACGRPVICLETGGPGLLVTPETGIRLPNAAPDRTISLLAEAMTRLADDTALRAQMGKIARKRVQEHFLWEQKIDFLHALYDQARISNGQ